MKRTLPMTSMGEAHPDEDRRKADVVVRRVAIISLAVNIGLVLVKLGLAWRSGPTPSTRP